MKSMGSISVGSLGILEDITKLLKFSLCNGKTNFKLK